MYLLRRKLNLFGVELMWDGQKVLAVSAASSRRIDVLEEHPARDLRTATERMAEIEAAYHSAASAMA